MARLKASYDAIPAQAPVRLAKKTSNLFRPRARSETKGLDVSGLDGVIEVDSASPPMSDALAKVAALPPEHADVLLLRALGHLDVDDVAQITGQETGAVRLLEIDALRLLREAAEPTIAEVG